MTTPQHTTPWTVEYLPYTAWDGHEIPNYCVSDADGYSVGETNEHTPNEVQVAVVTLIAAAPELLAVVT